ncbi:hypothetical protein, partial [Serratia nevei]|uniref:hypothetical protein n=1 Tax=Serratia nevei TaxID=2703794 RepID=UPI003F76EC3D
RPPPCKGDALPTELITHCCGYCYFRNWWVVQDDSAFGLALTGHHFVMLSFPIPLHFLLQNWWVVQDSNLRPID